MDDGLLAEAKLFAARTGRTLTAVIEDAVRQFLAAGKRPRGRTPVDLPRFRGRGLQPGVDLDDTAALLERMESK